MSEHINGWLTAYFDGQLNERRVKKVEAHLAACEECREELERLDSLRTVLGENPEAEALLPGDRFVAQVGLRLRPRPTRPTTQRMLSYAWIMAPVALFLIASFAQTLDTLTGWTGIAINLGILNDIVQVFPKTPESNVLGISSWRIWVSILTGLLALSWLASWWISQQKKQSENGTE